MKKTRILIVEDEVPIRDMLKFALSQKDFLILEAENAKEAELKIAEQLPDLIILDWMLPGKSGIEFAKQLKQNKLTQDIPIIMLTARAEEESKIRGLETGADDYMTKPFSPRELIARIHAVLRRGLLASPEGMLAAGPLRLNIHTQEVKINNQIIKLTPTNYRLLYFFMSHPNKVYSRERLLQQVWLESLDKDERVVDVQVKRLRQVLAPYGYKHFIKTVRSSGYKFSA